MSRTIRLYTPEKLSENTQVFLEQEHVHYIRNVLRMGVGDSVQLFNQEGAWEAILEMVEKKKAACAVQSQIRSAENLKPVCVIAAPLKKDSWDFAVHKAVELGATDFYPVFTEFTDAKRVNIDRMIATARDALQQCERLTPMTIHAPKTLEKMLDSFSERQQNCIYFCAERGDAKTAQEVFHEAAGSNEMQPYFLIGPEGGFSDKEIDRLRTKSYVQSVHLGPRILKAETALVSVLTLWQAIQGDWYKSQRT